MLVNKLIIALTYPQDPPTLDKTHILFTVPDLALKHITNLSHNTKITGIFLYSNGNSNENRYPVRLKDETSLSINVHGDVGKRIFASCIDIVKQILGIIILMVESNVTVWNILRLQLNIVKAADLCTYRQTYILIPCMSKDKYFSHTLFSQMKVIAKETKRRDEGKDNKE